ncbi:MAG: HAD-IC family P-type ATPase [Thermoplasmata archaeon]|nr:HAD-IC family P-type ATPase [Thermoplasmata archaeon]
MATKNLWYAMETKETLALLKTSAEKGLTSEEARRRLSKGKNVLAEKKKEHPVIKFLNQFKSIPIIMLIVAAIITVILTIFTEENHLSDTVAILIAITINAVMGYMMEARAEKAMEALKRMTAPKTKVVRDGTCQEILVEDVVPGDIVLLEEGDKVPADIRLIETTNLEVDESMLTGESVTVQKDAHACPEDAEKWERTNLVYMGTIVARGRAKGVVFHTGMETELGKIAKLVQESEGEETPLQKSIDTLGKQIGYIAIAISTLLFFTATAISQTHLSQNFLLAISLAVAIIPEGLPIVLVVTLAIGMQVMAKRNAIVRRLMCVETLGCTSVICTDKTGTLTKNQMTVKEVFVDGEILSVSGTGYEPKGEIENAGEHKGSIDLLTRIGILCNNANLLEENNAWKVIGDPTEGALLALAGKVGAVPKQFHTKYRRIYEKVFDPKKKIMSTINEVDGKKVIHIKGAPEVILSLSGNFWHNGKVLPLSHQHRTAIEIANKRMASMGYRVLALGYKEIEQIPENVEDMEKNMTFVGLVGIIDPPRPEVKNAIKTCHEAGIKVVMITGDQKDTAIAIAKQLGIWSGKILTGSELEKMSDDELAKIVEEVSVYARVHPEMKLKIVRAFKKRGHVVAMTGDGVNDAPALANADIGISMGITGTDVAKDASGIVLADDNFATIVKAVEEGRKIYENIRKFVRYQITTNIGATTLVFLAIFTVPGVIPLYPVQILWVNILIDGPPAQALGLEPATRKIMKNKPRNPKEHILSREMVSAILVNGLAMAFLTLLVFWYSYNFAPGEFMDAPAEREAYAQTMTFTTFVVFQVYSVLNCRNLRESLFSLKMNNRLLLITIVLALLLQLFAVYMPFMNSTFRTIPIRAVDWLTIFLLGIILICVDEIRKLVMRHRRGDV